MTNQTNCLNRLIHSLKCFIIKMSSIKKCSSPWPKLKMMITVTDKLYQSIGHSPTILQLQLYNLLCKSSSYLRIRRMRICQRAINGINFADFIVA